MADQNITELPVKTSSGMTSSDYMLGIDSAEGYQMLIKDLGDYIIRNVQVNTIAGANQTLKSALDTLNSNSHGILGTLIPETADFDTYQTPGVYTTTDTTQNVHAPVSLAGTAVRLFVEYRGINARVFQEAWVYQYSKFRKYCRVMSGASEWSAWELQPTRAEVDTLNSNTYSLKETKTIPDNSDLNTFITEGCYSVGNNGAASLTHCPHNYAFKMIVERCLDSPTNWFRQTIIVGNAPSMMYRRHTVNNGSTWSNWELLPQRSEIDALKNNMWKKASVTIPAGQTKSLVAGRDELSCFVSITGSQASIRDGLYYLSGYTTATRVSLITLNASSNISFDMTNNETVTIPITNSSVNPVTVTVLVLYKTGSDITFQ